MRSADVQPKATKYRLMGQRLAFLVSGYSPP